MIPFPKASGRQAAASRAQGVAVAPQTPDAAAQREREVQQAQQAERSARRALAAYLKEHGAGDGDEDWGAIEHAAPVAAVRARLAQMLAGLERHARAGHAQAERHAARLSEIDQALGAAQALAAAVRPLDAALAATLWSSAQAARLTELASGAAGLLAWAMAEPDNEVDPHAVAIGVTLPASLAGGDAMVAPDATVVQRVAYVARAEPMRVRLAAAIAASGLAWPATLRCDRFGWTVQVLAMDDASRWRIAA